jgi:hypothetical protein
MYGLEHPNDDDFHVHRVLLFLPPLLDYCGWRRNLLDCCCSYCWNGLFVE